jgi:ribose transport system permease protein
MKIRRFIDSFGIGFILFIICCFFSALSSDFFTAWNLSRILIQTSVNAIIAVGMTFVISAAEIDLSVGSLLGLCSILVAFMLRIDPETGMNLPMTVASTLCAFLPDLLPWTCSWWILSIACFVVLAAIPGIIGGGIMGYIVVRFAVPSFIVSLGFMMIYRGWALYLTGAQQIYGMPPAFMVIGSDPIFSVNESDGLLAASLSTISYAAVISIIVVGIGALFLSRSRFGRYVLAIGGNSQAAYLSGLPVKRTRIFVFMVSGLCVSVAAILLTSRLFIGDPNAGTGYELNAIAAVIIGGTSLFGGKGTVLGTFFGALIIGVLNNGLDLLSVNDHIKQMVIGSIIIFAVLLDYYRRKLNQDQT